MINWLVINTNTLSIINKFFNFSRFIIKIHIKSRLVLQTLYENEVIFIRPRNSNLIYLKIIKAVEESI